MEKSNIVVGKILFLHGHVYVRAADGTQVELKPGDFVHESDVIVTGQGAVLELVFDGGNIYSIWQNETVTIDKNVFSIDSSDPNLAVTHIDLLANQVTNLLANSYISNLDQLSDGPGDNEEENEGDSGHYFVQLASINEEIKEASFNTGSNITSESFTSKNDRFHLGIAQLAPPHPVTITNDNNSQPGGNNNDNHGNGSNYNNNGNSSNGSGNTSSGTPPSISINPIGVINNVESSAATPITVTGTVSHNVPVGNTVILHIDGHTYQGTVQSGGTYQIVVPADVLATAPTDVVTVSVSIATGNNGSASASQSYTVDLNTPAISLTIDPIKTINGTEAGSSNPIAVTGTVSANVPVGNTVTLIVDGHSYTGTAQSGSVYSINVPGNILANAAVDSVQVTISTTNAAGNTGSASATEAYNVELTAPGISIAIDPIAPLTTAEGASTAPILVIGTVSKNVPVGDIVTITVGGHSYTGTVQTGGTYAIGVPGNVLAGTANDVVHATVSMTDTAGNVATATAEQTYVVNATGAEIGISINPIGIINGVEAGSSSPVTITGTIDANKQTTASVSLTVDGHTYTGTVQPNGSYSVNVPGNVMAGAATDSVTIVVTTTDANGNIASASTSQTYSIELTAPPIQISINPITPISITQAGSSTPIAISGTVSANVPVGDTVTLTIGNHTYTGVVQPGDTFSIGVPGNILGATGTDSVHVAISATDAAGNVATASASQTYSVNPATAVITIHVDPIAPITASDATTTTPVTITGTMSSNVPAGSTVTVTVDHHSYTGIVQSNGTYSVGVPANVMAVAPSESLQVSVSTTNASGAVSTTTTEQTYTVGTTAATTIITVDPIATINGAEATSSAPIAITGSVSSNVAAGTPVTVTIGNQSYSGVVASDGNYSVGVPGNILANAANNNTLQVSVSTTDTSNHVTSTSVSQNYSVELAAPPISITLDPVAAINSGVAASSAPVVFNGSVSSNVPVGSSVSLTVGSHSYTGSVQADNTYSIGVPGTVLASAPVDSVNVSISTMDAAGNVATATTTQTYSLNVVNASIEIVGNPIPAINGAEAASSDPIAVTGTVTANIPVTGNIVSVTVDGHSYTGTVQADGTYSVGVPGNILAASGNANIQVNIVGSDGTGNAASASITQAYTVELTAPAIGIGIDPIATINGATASSTALVTVTGTVSANVAIGSTVVLTVDGHNYSGIVQAGGTYSIGIPGNVLGSATTDSIHASISATDAAGNVATAETDQTYAVELTAPGIGIGINPIATINGAEAASANPIAVTGTVSNNVPVGTTVTLTVDNHSYTGTTQSNGTYSIGIPGNILAAASTDSIHASVSTTDAVGNVANAGTDQAYTVELTAPAIGIGINPIAPVNGAEALSSAPVNITGTVSNNVPVGTTVTLTVDNHSYTGTVQSGATYSIGIPGNVLANASTDDVHASISTTDAAGNTATATADQTYSVNTVGLAISIGINPLLTINGAEAASPNAIAITGTVSANVPVGDTVTLAVGGHSYTGTVQSGGTYSIDVPGNILAAAGSDSIQASISVTDGSGNVSNASVTQAYTVELTAPAISVGIDPIAVINAAQAGSANLIAITGTVSSNVAAGDVVTLTVGGHTYTGAVQANGSYNIGVPGNVLAAAGNDNVHASISSTDAAGNVATASLTQAYTVELSAPAISISINPIATINGAEAASANPIMITGSVSTNVPVGDTVTLTVDGHTYTGTVQTGGSYSIGIPGNILAATGSDSIEVSIATTDAAGNTANASATLAYSVELAAPPIAVSMDALPTINGSEAASSNPVTITGSVSANVPAGNIVTLTVGGHSYTGTVQADGTYSVGIPGNVLANAGVQSIQASVSTTDAAGNVATTSLTQGYSVELTAPPISIGIDPIATINGTDAASANPIALTGTVSTNVPAGSIVTLTIDGNSYTGTVQAGGTYSVGVPGNILAGATTDSVHASISVTDAAGNVASAAANQSYVVELAASAISIAINPLATINGAEAASANPIAITGTVSANVPTGTIITLAVDSHTYMGAVQANGTYSIGIPGNVLATANTDNVHASVSSTDAAGNVASATANLAYAVELTAPPIGIGINNIAPINATEAVSSAPINITGTVSSNVPVGDTVTLTVDTHSYVGTVQAGGTYSIGIPGNVLANANTDNVHASISNTDAAGNTATASADQAYSVNLVGLAISIGINPLVAINAATAASPNAIAVSGTVSSNVPVGDIVTVTVGGQSYTGSVQAGGTYSVGIPGNVLAAAGNDSIQASISVTDGSGNISNASTTQAYTVELTAPPVSVSINQIATINGIEAASTNPIAVTGTVSTNVPIGDIVTLTVGGQSYTGTVQAGGTYSIGIPGNVLASAGNNTIQASINVTDTAGNPTSASATLPYAVELTAPAISVSMNAIATINGSEAASSSPVTVTGSVSANVPAGNIVTLTVSGHSYTGTVQADGTYSVGIPGNILANAGSTIIQASISTTDAAGNISTANLAQSYSVELTAPAVSISVDPIATINGSEAASANPVPLTGTVSANVPVGSIVTLTVGNISYTGAVQAGGTYSIGVPGNVLAAAASDSVHASISVTDAAGNVANAAVNQSYVVELNASAISVSINPIATVNGAEAASANPIAITGTVSANVPAGTTVTVAVDSHIYTGTVQANGSYSIGIPGNILGNAVTDSIHVSVAATDAAGNVANASGSLVYAVELTAPAIGIGINNIAPINGVEALSSAPVNITGTVSSNVPVGTIVTLTVDTHSYTGTVQAGDTYSIGIPGNVLANANTDDVHASIATTDAAGNIATASADQTYSVNTVGLAISIGINPILTINAAEAASPNAVVVTGTVSANVPVGDIVTMTVGGQNYTGTVQAGGTYSIGIPGNVLAAAGSDSIQASVSVTDGSGNVSNANVTQAYTVELTAPVISVSVNPIATINAVEAASANLLAVTGTVSANVPIGDIVTLTVGGQSYTGSVQVGGTYSIGIPGNVLASAGSDTIQAGISVTDAAGNTGNASVTVPYSVELTAPAISVGVDPILTINAVEAASAIPIAITGTVSANVPVGDIVTLTVNGNTYTGVVLAGGIYSIGVPGNVLAAATNDSVHVSVSTTDAAGNIASASIDQGYTVELTAPVVSVGINPILTINSTAAASSSLIAVTGTVSANVPVGDIVTLNVGGHSYTGSVQAGDTFSIGIPGNVLAAAGSDNIQATIAVTDAAGNTSNASATLAYTVELAAPPISISISPIVTINGAEAASSSPIAVTGIVSANVPVGDTVTLTVGSNTYTGSVLAGGIYSIGVPGNVLAAATNDTITASISSTDSVGNIASASASQTYTVALSAPAISIGIDPVLTINALEAASSIPIAITGTVGANVPVGDIVTLTVGGNSYTGSVLVGGVYSIGVPGNVLANASSTSIQASVSITDGAGNVSNANATQLYAVELAAPAISVSVNPILTINALEAASSLPIAVTGTVSANVPVGDTVSLTIGGNVYTGTVLAGGIYSIGVPGNILARATSDNVHVSVSATDAAGNIASASANQAYTIELIPPTVSVGINPIVTINGAEAASSNPIAVTGTVSANVPVGDIVTLTVGGHSYTGSVQAGDTYSIGIPGNILAAAGSSNIQAGIAVTDTAGNISTASATQAYTVELTAPAISIGINPILTVNGAEAASSNPIAVTGLVSANVPVGDIVSLTVGGNTYTGAVQAGGIYSIGIPGNVLATATSDSIHASISATDAAGNTASANATQAYTVELTAPAISININPITTITSLLAGSSNPVAITGTVSANVPVGNLVTLSVGGQTYTGTVQSGGTYSIGVPGLVLGAALLDIVNVSISTTDAAGNTASATNNLGYLLNLSLAASASSAPAIVQDYMLHSMHNKEMPPAEQVLAVAQTAAQQYHPQIKASVPDLHETATVTSNAASNVVVANKANNTFVGLIDTGHLQYELVTHAPPKPAIHAGTSRDEHHSHESHVLHLADLLHLPPSSLVEKVFSSPPSSVSGINTANTTISHFIETNAESSTHAPGKDTLHMALTNAELIHNAGAHWNEAALIQSLMHKGAMVE